VIEANRYPAAIRTAFFLDAVILSRSLSPVISYSGTTEESSTVDMNRCDEARTITDDQRCPAENFDHDGNGNSKRSEGKPGRYDVDLPPKK
jgi:hypothetical protein